MLGRGWGVVTVGVWLVVSDEYVLSFRLDAERKKHNYKVLEIVKK